MDEHMQHELVNKYFEEYSCIRRSTYVPRLVPLYSLAWVNVHFFKHFNAYTGERKAPFVARHRHAGTITELH